MGSTIFQLLLLFSGNSSRTFHATDTTKRMDVSRTIMEVELYSQINWDINKPDFEVFYSAVKGYNLLQDSLQLFEKPLLTIIDFSKPSGDERLWVVNIETRKLIIHSLVAHGRNSGEVTPERFSNKMNSFQSSLGFYKTGATYSGKHGLSLKLHGLEEGINDQAERRAIVIHGADYVSEKYLTRNGRLGRSQGCQAVSMAIHSQLIKAIQGKTCLFVYYPEKEYFQKSVVFNPKNHEQEFAYHSTYNQRKL